ncbi:hypothetical protein ACTQ11_08900, partial [Collinsella bouchesdurhonensis]|uniref:hypothetical protein n=1 Tax=Collinsella bouchesdurhonensis TaxID=1907654 RepID=UPI003F8EDC2C
MVTVTTSAGRVTVPHVGGVPVVGDRVGLVWGASGGMVVGRIGAAAAPPPPAQPPADPDPPQRDPVRQETTVTAAAVQASTARSGS